jgi:CspA family cold shock protein
VNSLCCSEHPSRAPFLPTSAAISFFVFASALTLPLTTPHKTNYTHQTKVGQWKAQAQTRGEEGKQQRCTNKRVYERSPPRGQFSALGPCGLDGAAVSCFPSHEGLDQEAYFCHPALRSEAPQHIFAVCIPVPFCNRPYVCTLRPDSVPTAERGSLFPLRKLLPNLTWKLRFLFLPPVCFPFLCVLLQMLSLARRFLTPTIRVPVARVGAVRLFSDAANGAAAPAAGGAREVGTVKWFSKEKGFGFITRSDGTDVFVHFSNVRGTGFRTLEEGQSVDFTVAPGKKGQEARVRKKEGEKEKEQNRKGERRRSPANGCFIDLFDLCFQDVGVRA